MRPLILQADAARLPLADASVDMVFASPPYADARHYGDKGAHARSAQSWVDWMLDIVTELTRVTRGLVLVNCAGVTRARNYWPCCEGLCWEWFKRGGNLWRPAYWHRVGIPGSGGKQWLRADIEYVLCFKRDAEWLPWADNTANGHPPKWGPGGEPSYRNSDGSRANDRNIALGFGGRQVRARAGKGRIEIPFGASEATGNQIIEPKPMYRRGRDGFRVNERRADGQRAVDENNRCERGNEKGRVLGKLHTKSLADGSDEVQYYLPPVLANPGNLIRGIKVGGGVLGHPLAHKNEAPFPVKLAAWFIRSWCPPGGTVLDCFGGSGTTAQAAVECGRNAILSDIRFNQCELSRERLSTPAPIARQRERAKKLPKVQTLWDLRETA